MIQTWKEGIKICLFAEYIYMIFNTLPQNPRDKKTKPLLCKHDDGSSDLFPHMEGRVYWLAYTSVTQKIQRLLGASWQGRKTISVSFGLSWETWPQRVRERINVGKLSSTSGLHSHVSTYHIHGICTHTSTHRQLNTHAHVCTAYSQTQEKKIDTLWYNNKEHAEKEIRKIILCIFASNK